MVHLITLAQLSLSVALGNRVLQLAWNVSGSSCCLSRYTELMTRNCRVYILDLPSGISEYCTHKTATICKTASSLVRKRARTTTCDCDVITGNADRPTVTNKCKID